MAAEITDPFTYSNGNLDGESNWTLHNNGSGNGSFSISSNSINTPSNVDCSVRNATAISSADHYAQLDVTAAGGGGSQYTSIGPMTRMGTTTSTVSGFLAACGTDNSSGSYRMYRIVSASFTVIDSGGSGAAGVVYMESDGSSQYMLVDDAEVIGGATTDTNLASNTGVGIYGYEYGGGANTADDFEAGTLGAAAAASAPLPGRHTKIAHLLRR